MRACVRWVMAVKLPSSKIAAWCFYYTINRLALTPLFFNEKRGGRYSGKIVRRGAAALVAVVAVAVDAVVCATSPQPWGNAAMAAFLRNKKPGVCDLGHMLRAGIEPATRGFSVLCSTD